jgi:hypothetical protein
MHVLQQGTQATPRILSEIFGCERPVRQIRAILAAQEEAWHHAFDGATETMSNFENQVER